MKTFLFALVISVSAAVNLTAQIAPKVISNPDPVYPAEAAQLGFGGTVKLVVNVDEKGKVKVLKAWGPNAPCSKLDDKTVENIRKAVTDAARKVEFEPPMKDGKPTEIELTISYSFDSSGNPTRLRDNANAKGRILDAGVLQGRVKFLARPDYSGAARANRVSGAVPVSVLVDIDGRIIAASALGGHPLLQQSAVEAACRSSIERVQLSGTPVQDTGVLTYNFVP